MSLKIKQISDFITGVAAQPVGTATAIAIGVVQSDVDANQTAIEGSLATETAARIAADGTLTTAVASNATRAVAIESAATALAVRVTTNEGDVSTLEGDVTSIDTRAVAIESAAGTLSTAVTSNATRAGVIEGTVSTEKAARIAADGTLTTAVASNATRAGDIESAATTLAGRVTDTESNITAILLSSDADKDSFAEIVALINSVDLTNDDALAAVVSNLNAEISSTNSDHVVINAALSSEVVRAGLAEVANADDIVAINTTLDGLAAIYVDEAELSAAVLVEKLRAESAENGIQTSLGQLDQRITGNATNISGIQTTLSGLDAIYVDDAELSDAVSDGVVSANSYTDGEISTLDASLQAYADAAESAAIASAESKDAARAATTATNLSGAVSDLQAYADAAETAAIASANSYTDGKVTTINTTTSGLDSRIVSLEGYIMEDTQMYIETFVGRVATAQGANLEYTLVHPVQDSLVGLVDAYINGHRVEVFSVVANVVQLKYPGYVIDANDSILISYQGA